jgi:hypothetical protein
MRRAGLTENSAAAVDVAALGEDQEVVDELAVDPHARQVTDDDPRPAVGGAPEGRPLAGAQPTQEAHGDPERRSRSGKLLGAF